MKKINKYFAVFSALLLTVTSLLSVAPAFADEATTNTVTLHKILQTESNLNKSNFPGTTGLNGDDYKGESISDLAEYFGSGSKEIDGAFFALALEEEKDGVVQYVKAKANDKLTPDLITKGTPATTTKVEEAVGGLTTGTGIVFNTAGLKGNFKIIELKDKSTYNNNGSLLAASKAVPVKITLPLVSKDGVVKDAHVYPKNTETKPEVDKNFAKTNDLTALKDATLLKAGADYKNYSATKATVTAEIGKVIPYEVKTKVLKGSKYEKLVWTDTMSNGLTMGDDVNLAVSGTTTTFIKDIDYTLSIDDRGFTLKFKATGLDKLEEAAKASDVEFTLTYKATVNGQAIIDNPEVNDIKLDYGNKPGTDLSEQPVTPEDGEVKVTKTWAAGANKADAKVVYTLKNATKQVVASVALTAADTKGTINLGKGMTFEITGAFSGTFKGLQNKAYTVSERVAGYTNAINVTGNAVAITNTPDSDNPTPLNPTQPKVETHGKKFVKVGDADARLAGAQFVVKNSAGKFLALKEDAAVSGAQTELATAKTDLDNAIKAYNGLTKAQQEGADGTSAKELINTKQSAYDAAFIKARTAYIWVDEKTKAITFTSNNQGQFEVTGFEVGSYKLEETLAPAGYAKLSGDIEFTVGHDSYTSGDIKYKTDDASNNAQKVFNKKVTIPQTGGIGTILFTIIGLSIMLGAVVIMKRRQSEEA
ncbi:TPA: pilin N-terminal domain-containing protein [Streptococcus agalactiae]|nr:isopeptide-forming domain-containing fimbrial protein [Streptococcus agalactiae]